MDNYIKIQRIQSEETTTNFLVKLDKSKSLCKTVLDKQSRILTEKQLRKGEVQSKSGNILDKVTQYHPVAFDSRKITKKIYILYTSGSVGANEKLEVYKDYLRQQMILNTYLCDYKFTKEHQNHEYLISPELENGYRVMYKIQSLPCIQASVNIKLEQIVHIAEKIKQNYEDYDAFVIITGLDVICHIATIISFMLENLSKLVVFTGAHFPISYCCNDFITNIIESFTIISLAKGLNDVIIVCKNKGYRANRSIKIKQNQIDTISSPNFHSLASIDIKIRFKSNLFLPIPTEPFNVFTKVSQKVHIIKFHLFMNKSILKYQLENPDIIGYVIESYTVANLPYASDLLDIFKQASQNHGKIFVNISPNIYKQKKSILKEVLEKYHIYFGGDITTEAAIAKLSYLIGKGYSKEQIKLKISMNLRGQLTQNKLQNQFETKTQGFIEAIEQVLQDYYPTSNQQKFLSILQDEVGKCITSKTAPSQFELVFKYLKKSNESENIQKIIDRNFLLHNAVKHENMELIKYFLDLKIQRDILDQDDCSALFYGIKGCNKGIIQLLYKRNCHVVCPIDFLMDVLIIELKKDNLDYFQMLYHIQFKTTLNEIVNCQKRNIAHIAALLGAEKCLDFLIRKFKFQLSHKDMYGSLIEDYAKIQSKKVQKKISFSKAHFDQSSKQ